MKKTLSLFTLGLVSVGFSFAQNVSFENSYSKIIDSMTSSYPTLTNKQVLVNSGSLQTTIDIQANEFGYGTMKTDISHVTITDVNKLGGEITMRFNSMLNGNIMGQNIENLKIGVTAKVISLSNTVYVQIKDLSLDLQGLPLEFQTSGKEFQSHIEKTIKNQWIKIPMPKEATDDLKKALNQGSSLDPQVIISLLKKYPIVYNAGYANNNYAVKLDGKNIMKLITTLHTKLGDSTNKMSLSEKRKMIAFFNAISINGTLSDADKPILSFQTSIKQDNMIGTGTMTMGDNKMNMKIDADILDSEVPVTVGASISTEQTSASSSSYNMNFYGKMYDNETTPSSMMFTLQGDNSRAVLNNYKIKRPRGAKTMKQIEKMVEKKKVVPSAYYIQKGYQEIVDGNFDSSERLSKKGLLLIKRGNTTNLQDLSALYNNLCRAQTKQGKPEEALINCDLSIESNSSNAAAYDSRAVLYMGMGNYDKALLDIEKGLLIVEDYRFYDTKALIYDAMGKTNEAKTAREKSKAMQN